jgi:hypothetical protein
MDAKIDVVDMEVDTTATSRVVMNPDAAAKRAAIWRQLIAAPQRDVPTIVLVCAEEGIDPTPDYVLSTRARWRNTIAVLKAAGYSVPE